MTKMIIHTNEDGSVSVTIPSGEISIEEVLAKDCPDHAIIVNRADLPNKHHDFFNAWELVDGQVTVNIGKATDITKARLRAERKPLMEAQDVLFQRALESGTDTKAIVAEKQRLRDITKISVTTLDELKGLSA
jgi:hypothetical protein